MDIQTSIPDNIYELLSKKPNGNKINLIEKLGYSQYAAKFYTKLWKAISWNTTINSEQESKTSSTFVDKAKIKQNFEKDKASIEVNSLTISTIDQAIEAANVDLTIWEIDRSVVNSWQMTMKLKDAEGNEYPQVRTNYQVKIHLKPRVKSTIEETLKLFREKLPKNPTSYPKLPKKPEANLMLECGLVDQHFGMLAWAKETLSDYDLKIAEILYVEAVKKAMERIANPEKIGKILIPIGHDFFHINDQSNTTPRAGHQLDVDGRLPKVYSTGKMAAIKVIDYCRKIAPVEIVYVSGNHDPQMSYFLCDTIAAWYRNCPDVIVDMTDGIVKPTKRKYVRWGKGLLGMTHGLDEKLQDLPLIMANEVPKMWSATIYREIHIGHYHKVRSSFKHYTDTITPVIVRTLPSLCGTDDFSYSHGWLSSGVQAAEFHLWDKEFGQVQYISVKAEEII